MNTKFVGLTDALGSIELTKLNNSSHQYELKLKYKTDWLDSCTLVATGASAEGAMIRMTHIINDYSAALNNALLQLELKIVNK